MSHQSEADKDLIREQSAELAAMLGQDPARVSRTEGGSAPLPPTRNERKLLAYLADGKPRRPDEMIDADPERWARVPMRSALASIHLTAASLARKGLISRHKRTHAGTYRRAYKLTEAGRQA